MARFSRTGAAALLIVLLLGGTLWSASASRLMARFQNADAEVVEVASGPLREPTLALDGRGDFGPETVVLFGVVSAIGGLGDTDLFTAETQDEPTARFTFVAELTVDSVNNQADVTITAASGQMRVYFNASAGATWSDRESFAAGQVVAEYSLDLRETLHRQAPGIGLAVGAGNLVQTTGEEFSLGDEQFRFGFADMGQRLRYVGAVVPGSGSGPATVIRFTGNMEVSAREAIIGRVGGPGSVAEAATPAADGVCAPFEPWLSETVERLAQIGAVESAVPADSALESLDADALRQAADDVAALVAEQRESAVPGEAASANRLTVTALSTYARGLQTVADAADAQNADLLAQGQTAMRDGKSLLARAAEAVNGVAPECALGAA